VLFVVKASKNKTKLIHSVREDKLSSNLA
jgi:hypothetical protein